MNPIVQPLLVAAVESYSTVRDALASAIVDESGEQDDVLAAVRPLVAYMSERTQTVVLLIQDWRLFDAEIVMRSVTEATLRATYICSANAVGTRVLRAREFWVACGEINSIRQAVRGSELADFDPGPLAQEFRALGGNRLVELRARWPRNERRRVESRWKFDAVLETLRQEWPDWPADGLEALRFQHNVASHLLHADETAIGLMIDRAERDAGERIAMDVARACRQISDLLHWPFFVLFAAVRAFHSDQAEVGRLWASLEPLNAELAKHATTFADLVAAAPHSDPETET